MSALIAPGDLAGLLESHGEPPIVLDVRWKLGRSDGYEQYLAGHVPGAAFVDLETDLADPPGPGGRHPLPDPQRFAEAMRRCGVSRTRTVVVYDATAGLAAARAWWLLRYHAHPDVRLLDGGWNDWPGAVETGEASVAPGDFDADPGHLPVVDAEGAADVARQGVLLDARAPERFRGEHEPVDPVAGHVPGAVNVSTSQNLRDGRWRSPEDLAEVYAATDREGPVAAYCGSGVTATHDLFALHLIGRQGALYAGSWSEWVTDPDRPVATGA
jgi:thiosulfate/3-mercaptopyruvate sulfurtransferase